jgi:hypothetical protein
MRMSPIAFPEGNGYLWLFSRGCCFAWSGWPRLGAFAGARIGFRALPAAGKSATMTQAAIAADVHEPFDILGDFASKIAFNDETSLNNGGNPCDFLLGQIANASVAVHAGGRKDFLRSRRANSENVGQTDLYAFVSR